jgi:hypothetical protein
MSEIKVNKISPKQTCTQLTLGDSGDTIIIPAGATITNNGTATGFGRTGTVDWDTTPKTTTVTAVSGVGYFVDTTTTTLTVNLPVGVAGDIVAISDYANTAATNKITIDPNGTDKINGLNQNAEITTNGASVTLIYIDATRGWKDINDATLNVTGINPFVAATGGTITTCGDFKIHTFTGPGTFTVTCAGTPAGSTTVDYLVVAGGGAGARGCTGGGGGAGGYRTNFPSSCAGVPVTATGYPITVGGGAARQTAVGVRGDSGTPTVALSITSTGGGGGGGNPPTATGGPGGSGGGGAGYYGSSGGTGNTPPTSPSQGNNGGTGQGPTTPPAYGAGGGGGASAVGANGTPTTGGAGGAGSGIAINPSPTVGTPGPSAPLRYFAGGGGGGVDGAVGYSSGGIGGGGPGGGASQGATDGTTNTGGGGGGTGEQPAFGGGGGSGIVIIRYKFQ